MSHDHSHGEKPCCAPKHRRDWLLIVTSVILAASYIAHLVPGTMTVPYVSMFVMSIVEMLHTIWWGVALGIVAAGILSDVPRAIVVGIFGKPGTLNGILRATLGGLLLDLCSHGILMVGMQLYKRGIGLGQLMAFLIASPWNSLSLTLILWSLVGLPWTLVVLFLSFMIAIVSGLIFNWLEHNGILPRNPYSIDLPADFSLRGEMATYLRTRQASLHGLIHILRAGLRESTMVLRWIFFGLILTALIRTFIPADVFASLFGPSLLGLGATLLFATILEVCSEGSTPVAADFLLRAKAPGNMFAFLMTGVSTDYTEILSIKSTTKSWKIALFLPLVTVPQVIVLALVLNQWT